MTAFPSPAQAARLLGGETFRGREILCPGPGHSRQDRSLQVLLHPAAPDGIVVRSYAGDDFRECRDHVKERLGITFDPATRSGSSRRRENPTAPALPARDDAERQRERRTGWALEIWAEAVSPKGTPVEAYLNGRGLHLGDDVAGQVLRWHPACPWRDKATGKNERRPAMVALMRDVASDEPKAIHRTLLDPTTGKAVLDPATGLKSRRMLGDATGVAVKLDADETVTINLALGEGIETVLSARALGFRPAWATCTVATIGGFPVLPGVEVLTLLGETDRKGANARAIEECGERWHADGREVVIVAPKFGGDINDALQHGGHA